VGKRGTRISGSNKAVYYLGIALIVLIAVPLGVMAVNYSMGAWGIDFQIPWPFGTVSNGGGTTTGDGTVLSNKLGITLMDKYKGSGMASLHIYVYDGITLLEDLTTASTGYIASTGYYPSGKVLNVKIDTGNSEIWKTITVPVHSAAMVEAGAATPITLYGTIGPTITDALQDQAGNAITDGGTYNVTDVSYTFAPTYSAFVGTDDTGLLNSDADPIYGMTPRPVLVLEVSGNNYAQCSFNGFDGKIVEGSKHIYYKILDVASLSKDKSGTTYINGMDGADSFSFSADLTGIDFSSAVTCQLYIYSEADPSYRMSHASWGPDATQLCESTWTIIQ
jgi:hypothetical protein